METSECVFSCFPVVGLKVGLGGVRPRWSSALLGGCQ